MTTQEIAERLVSLCQEGAFAQAAEELYSPDIVSVENDGDPREVQGMEAIKAKMEWWMSTYEVLDTEVDGPWVNDPQFIVEFEITVKDKNTGEVTEMEELAVYTVADGKIVHERFFNM
jgi:ketosteroid isomerase-like protein